jgi:hypothetical protein
VIVLEIEGSLSLADAQHVLLAPRQALVRRPVNGHVGLDVIAIDAIQGLLRELAASDLLNQLVREQNVDIRRKDEPAARASYPHVLGDHLEQMKAGGMCEAMMQRRRYNDDPCVEVLCSFGPLKGLRQGWPIRWWIPFNDDELDVDTMMLRLRRQPIDEELRAMVEVSAVVVITCRDDNAEVGFGVLRVHDATSEDWRDFSTCQC